MHSVIQSVSLARDYNIHEIIKNININNIKKFNFFNELH